jgi:carboxylesterase type B
VISLQSLVLIIQRYMTWLMPQFLRQFPRTFVQVPLIVGHNKDEGAMFLPQFLNNPEKMEEMDETFDVLGPVLIMGMDEQAVTDEDSAAANIYRTDYLDGDDSNFTDKNSLKISKLMGDVRYVGPIHMGVDLLRRKAEKPVYYYMYRWGRLESICRSGSCGKLAFFSFRGQNSLTDHLTHDSSALDLGTCHSDELYLLLDDVDPGAHDKLAASIQDMAMSKKLVSSWIAFAKTAVPDRDWEPVNGKTESREDVC